MQTFSYRLVPRFKNIKNFERFYIQSQEKCYHRFSSLSKKNLSELFVNEQFDCIYCPCSQIAYPAFKKHGLNPSGQFRFFNSAALCNDLGNDNEALLHLLDTVRLVRFYSKAKDKGNKGHKGKSHVDITPEELGEVVNVKQMLREFEEIMEELKEDLVKAVAVRTNIGSLEQLPIELEGDTYPLNEIAQVHRKSPQLVVINCSAFPQASKSVADAIRDSGMNLNPQQEGTTIAVPLPKVTREHREGLLNKAKLLGNKSKEGLRRVHNAHVKRAKDKEGKVSQDLIFKVTQKIKELQEERVKEVEAMLATKQTELLKS